MRLESAHMDKKLLLIRHLYGEADEESKLNQLLEEPDLKEEYQALSEAKFWLDHTKREKPTDDALQNVLAMAAHPDNLEAGGPSANSAPADTAHPIPDTGSTKPNDAGPSARSDRAPMPRQRLKRRIFGLSSFAMAIVITAIIGYQWFAPGNSTDSVAFEQQVASGADANPEMKSLNEAESLISGSEAPEESDLTADFADAEDQLSEQMQRSAANSPALTAASVDSTLPDWDKVEDIIRYKQRIDMLLEQNQDLTWDEPAVPLEMLAPDRLSNPQLQQTRSRSNNN